MSSKLLGGKRFEDERWDRWVSQGKKEQWENLPPGKNGGMIARERILNRTGP